MYKSELNKIVNKSLGFDDLYKLWASHPLAKGKIHVVEYNDIIKSDKLNDYLKDRGIIIYYPSTHSYGHYVALLKNGDKVYFSDSYGGLPDVDQKKFSRVPREDLYREQSNTLIKHFLKSKYKIDYNHHVHQAPPPVATCGRHSLMRLLMNELTNEEYHALITNLCKRMNITPDELVSLVFH